MVGFMMAGKAFVVCEELRLLAERNKGKTVLEMLQEKKILNAEDTKQND